MPDDDKVIYQMMLVAAIAIGAALLMTASQASADEFSAGFGFENSSCGSGELNASMAYDRDSDDIPAHFRLNVSPNGSCSAQGLSVDASVEKRAVWRDQWYAVAGAGYDLRTLPFEYLPEGESQFKFFRGVEVETAQAFLGLGWDCGTNCYVQTVYNFNETPLGKGGNLFPVSVIVGWEPWRNFEINATTNTEIHTANVVWDIGKIELGASVSGGFHKLEHPAPAILHDAGRMYQRAGAPNPLYQFDVRWNF